MRIFLSYRRSDSSDFAGLCFEHYSSQFGARSIFLDRESIPPDVDWEHRIRAGIDAADAVLCIIGPQWNTLLQQRRNDASDSVRFELECAVSGHRPVIVVLIDGAAAPTADQLPPTLSFLATTQAAAFDSRDAAASFRLLDNRLKQFAPQVAAPRAWSQAELARRPWVDRGLHTPGQHPAWWQLWNLHDPDVLQRITAVLSEHSSEPGVVLLAGPENSGRRYLLDAAVRKLRATRNSLHLLRINLDGFELHPQDPLEAYIRYQAQRLGIGTGRGQQQGEIQQLCSWLKTELHAGAASINTCASVGLLLELCGSFTGVLRILHSLKLRPALLERTRLLVCLLEHFANQCHTIVHVEDFNAHQLLRDDLISTCLYQQRLRLVFSVLPDVDQTYLLGHRTGLRIDVPRFEAEQLQQVLSLRFGPNTVPSWLPRLLQQQTGGQRGLTALLLIELFQQEALQWDSEEHWSAGTLPPSNAVPASLSRLLQPLDRLFQETPHLESLLRIAALCGELVPITLLLDFLHVPEDQRDDLMEVVDDELCEGPAAIPILADLGYSHPGFRTQRKINVYRFLCPLDRRLLLQGTSTAWQEQQAQALLQFLDVAMPESTRGLAGLYLQLHEFLPDGQAMCQTLKERLQWWIDEIEAERFREHIVKAMHSKRLSGEAVWQAIRQNEGKASAAMQFNLLLAYEQQKDGIPTDNAGHFYSRKGTLLYELARFPEAEFYLRKALTIAEGTEGPDHPDVAISLNNLALLLKSTNRLSEAEPLYRRALAIREQSYGPDHPEVATSLNNLALLLAATNRLCEAEPLHRRALAIDELSYGPDHPDVATSLNNLAALLESTNRLPEAEPLYRRALAIKEQSYGPDHPSVATGLNNLAELLRTTNRLPEAEPLYRRALAIFEQSYGPDHPDVATSLNNLAGLLESTDRLPEAEPLYRRALAIREQSYDPDHPHVATSLNNLALLLESTNRLSEAEPLYRRALAIREQSYGPDHPEVAISLNNLAVLLFRTNRASEAERLYGRACRILEQFADQTGHEHPDYQVVKASYAWITKPNGGMVSSSEATVEQRGRGKSAIADGGGNRDEVADALNRKPIKSGKS